MLRVAEVRPMPFVTAFTGFIIRPFFRRFLHVQIAQCDADRNPGGAHLARQLDEARDLQYRLLKLFDAMVYSAEFPEGFRAAMAEKGFDIEKSVLWFDDSGLELQENLTNGPEFGNCTYRMNSYKQHGPGAVS